ncbi:MAG: F0F1 ATP synthase subunit A [Ardenticatenaceae bacterium]|nr:F0F1 ATP synthase subunit A [Ardenticatenaceae bacterium]
MRRVLIYGFIILLVLMSCGLIPLISPVRPFIQLPGEVYPGTEGLPLLNGWTNTFSATLLAWTVVLIIAFSLRARSRTADEVPTGFYNFFEMIVEGAYNFAENIAGPKKIKDFFPFFMTYILIILVSNLLGLMPGFDSVGIWEHKPHFEELKAIAAAEDEGLSQEEAEEIGHDVFDKVDEENKGDLRVSPLGIPFIDILVRKDREADPEAPIVEDHNEKVGFNPEAADWTIVPFFRPAATDLNMTLAFALIAMVMVQFYGFKYLGVRGYLAKFFPFIAPGFGAEVGKNPIRAIDVAVGALELVSEISKVLSFAFRLLGNIFAGMVLLFVMAFLLPAANLVFFGLEFFVGIIQALVFALLMLIFMVGATESHHGDDHDDHH